YRLCVFPIYIPPLRERQQDIPALVDYYLRRKSKEIGLHFIPGLIPGTMERLVEYTWPGNVRELSNAVERAMIIHGGKPLSFEDIVGVRSEQGKGVGLPSEGTDYTFRAMEVRHIRRALEAAGGKVEGEKGAAALLGINPGTLRSRMRRLGILFGKAAKAGQRIR
ncbi:MAG TPA: Fis family transcriptional regulator, partial [Syntrophorhabdus aromaticivorans]|nr:Fis family transcriptional regulator [Syntrophorhabdus aromaticivorans]